MTHVQRMLCAKDRLPEQRRRMFELLFQLGASHERVREELGLTPAAFDSERTAMLRSLRGAAA